VNHRIQCSATLHSADPSPVGHSSLSGGVFSPQLDRPAWICGAPFIDRQWVKASLPRAIRTSMLVALPLVAMIHWRRTVNSVLVLPSIHLELQSRPSQSLFCCTYRTSRPVSGYSHTSQSSIRDTTSAISCSLYTPCGRKMD
jgi:hypothetical protein